MKLVINSDYGGFGLSEDAKVYLASRAPDLVDSRGRINLSVRHHPMLVETVERFGDKANDDCSKLEVIDIPDGIEYGIGEYDGVEFVYEIGHVWGNV